MPGPVGITFRTTDFNPGDEIRPGKTVSVRVKDILPGGKVSLVVHNKLIIAKSHLFFRPGQVFTARVEHSGNALRLRLLEGTGMNAYGTPPDTGGPLSEHFGTRTLLFSAILRAGLPLPDGTEAARRSALLERTRGRKLLMARLYAEIVSKGADPGADFLEAVSDTLEGRGGRRNGHGGESRREWPQPPSPKELSSEVVKEEGGGEPLLDLLSNVDGHDGRWTFRRMERRLDGREMDLTWKIRRGKDPALALTIKDGKRLFEFLLSGKDKPRMACYVGDDVEIDETVWDRFKERLALLNFIVSDTLQPIEESDGFTEGAAEVARDLEERL